MDLGRGSDAEAIDVGKVAALGLKRQHWKPPYRGEVGAASVFLAGSIEMGKATRWQEYLAGEIIEAVGLDVTVFDPRRDDWDPEWKQREDCPPFKAQVEWELEFLERADIVAMHLEPGTLSPISLLEFGMFAKSEKLVVCCPLDFGRSGNVWVTGHYEGSKCMLVETMGELKAEVVSRLKRIIKERRDGAE
ncbi:hypothetical protein G7Y89_g12626 [Cudoniella acicularis]|uniref:Nucleoside 2-deoxyribosyltransferase n=1 Tax=Cudoniella acicularis TaxID=354080 RepID=A0A8H4VX68_9HELO|nr:hypothetical protein G7Y89_g12626 [Cudoniella acicularis]